jgi:hypothetical protein
MPIKIKPKSDRLKRERILKSADSNGISTLNMRSLA